MKEFNHIPDQILDLLTRSALNKLEDPGLHELRQWMEQNPGRVQACNVYMDRVRKFYWLHLSKETVEPEVQIEKILQRQALQKSKINVKFRLLAYAATFLILIGIAWFLFQLSGEPEAEIAQAEVPFLERHNRAVLVLSDGNSLVLDNPESADLPGETGVRITNRPGELLSYEQQQTTIEAQRFNRLIVPAGARYQLQLSDGTRVWMNAQSELEYPVAFSSSLRKVKLTGEAYFEVQSDALMPLIIEANGYEIFVHGTAFNVSAYNDDHFIQTTLVSGAVEISSRQGSKYKLNPGQMAMINHQNQEIRIENVDTRLFTSWREGILYFNKISLKELSTKLERWYDVEISFENELAAGFQFSGAMENSRDIGFLLNLIGKAADVEFEISEKQITVK